MQNILVTFVRSVAYQLTLLMGSSNLKILIKESLIDRLAFFFVDNFNVKIIIEISKTIFAEVSRAADFEILQKRSSVL